MTQVEDKISKSKDYTDEEALNLILEDEDAFKSYLYYTSAKCIKRIQEPKNADLLDIVTMEDKEEKVKAFNDYLRNDENLKKFQRIFPIIATTSISAHKVGKPGVHFDMVVMDEASQGNIATSLVPILRGEEPDACGRSTAAKSGYFIESGGESETSQNVSDHG